MLVHSFATYTIERSGLFDKGAENYGLKVYDEQ
jgi:hypothetical protein